MRTSNSQLNVVSINGCCYGKDSRPDKGDYFKYCGQEFWHFISGEENLFIEIIEPLGYKAKEKNEAFMNSYAQMLNKFTKEFTTDYCKETGDSYSGFSQCVRTIFERHSKGVRTYQRSSVQSA